MPQGDTHKMAEWLGVQTLGYLSADGLVSSTHGKRTSLSLPPAPAATPITCSATPAVQSAQSLNKSLTRHP